MYELSNYDHVLGVVSQTRVSGHTRTDDAFANSLAHYYQDTSHDFFQFTMLKKY